MRIVRMSGSRSESESHINALLKAASGSVRN